MESIERMAPPSQLEEGRRVHGLKGAGDDALEGTPLGWVGIGEAGEGEAQRGGVGSAAVDDDPLRIADDADARAAELLRRRVTGSQDVEHGDVPARCEVRQHGRIRIEEEAVARTGTLDPCHEG